MQLNHFHSGCPVVKRSQESFVQWVNVGGERQRIEFTKVILWLQKSETTLQYLHGGQVIKQGETLNDFYGYLTSCRVDQFQVETAMEYFGVTPDSSLELVLQTRVFLAPVFESPEAIEHNKTKPDNYKSMYAYVPDEWRQEIETDGEKRWPQLEDVELTKEVVWSSKNTSEQNDELMAQFLGKWEPVVEAPPHLDEWGLGDHPGQEQTRGSSS